MGLNRAAKRNAFDREMLNRLALAYGRLHSDPDLRCGVLFAHGDHFTGGLDLADVAPVLADAGFVPPEGGIDPLGLYSEPVAKPVVLAAQGICLTIGIELMLASDIRLAARGTRFAQIEIKRGLYPVGGATLRFARDCGWGNAMRYLLTGDEFGAEEALRIGLVQEVTEPDRLLERAIEIAETVARQAPLGVMATLRSARRTEREGYRAALDVLVPELRPLMNSDDAREGIQAFLERRDGSFSGT